MSETDTGLEELLVDDGGGAHAPAPTSVEELYERQFAPMVRLARLLVGSPEVAADIVQDAFVHVHGKWKTVRFPESYLRQAVVNGCRSHHRHRAVERRAPELREASVLLPARELLDAIAKLQYRERVALVLRFYEDLPDAEIAELLGCRVGTVASLVHSRARALEAGDRSMKLDETDLRATLHDLAVTTPVPDRWDAIVAGSARARRRRTVAVSGSAFVALAAAVVVTVVAVSGSPARFDVTAGSPLHAPNAVFPHGPSIELSALKDGHLAFVSNSNLYVVDGAAQTARQLTHSGDASALSWSADGEWLAFSVRDAPGYEDYTTWITRADGTHARPLDGMGDVFAWSPTGHYLAVGGYCCTDLRGGLFVVTPEREQNYQLVAPGTNIMSIAWAPDGTAVGYTAAAVSGAGTSGAFTVDTDGARPRRVSDGQFVTWTPNGKSLLVSDTAGIELVGVADHVHHLLGASTALDPRYPAVWYSFSADGKQIAFVADWAADTMGTANAIEVCHTDGTACQPVVSGSTVGAFGPSFSPDGSQLTFVSGHALRVLTFADGKITVLEHLGRDLLQGAGDGVHVTRGTYPNVPVWLSDGTILYRHGDELRVIDPNGGTPHVVAHPVGFSDSGAKDQGLPGGAPMAENQLGTSVSP